MTEGMKREGNIPQKPKIETLDELQHYVAS